MQNNKQQTAVEWFVEELTKQNMFMNLFSKEIEQAKEMEIAGKEMSYADGYREGYKRALDYMTDTIKNKIETRKP